MLNTIDTKAAIGSKLNNLAWNADSLGEKRSEPIELSQQLEVICVSETHLAEHYPDSRIPLHNMYQNNRSPRGGGTAIYVRSNHDMHKSPTLHFNLKVTAIVLTTSSLILVRIVTVYARDSVEFMTRVNRDQLPLIIAWNTNANHCN